MIDSPEYQEARSNLALAVIARRNAEDEAQMAEDRMRAARDHEARCRSVWRELCADDLDAMIKQLDPAAEPEGDDE